MKRSIRICSLMVLVAAFGSAAKAVPVNPAEWTIILATDGEDVSWGSTDHVATDYLQYDYEWQWELTDARLRYNSWFPVLGYIPAADKGSSGTDYELPFVILDQDFGEPGVFAAHVTAGVDINGCGYVSMTDITLGSFLLSDVVYDVTGAWFEVDATVTAVPEPGTLSLLALSSLLLLRKRRL